MQTEEEMNKGNEWKDFLDKGGNPILKQETEKPKRLVSIRQQRAVKGNTR